MFLLIFYFEPFLAFLLTEMSGLLLEFDKGFIFHHEGHLKGVICAKEGRSRGCKKANLSEAFAKFLNFGRVSPYAVRAQAGGARIFRNLLEF